MTSNRIFLYCVFSTLAVLATTINACRAHSNFYSVAIYLANSSRSVLILANFGFLGSLLFGRVLQKLFFGSLQPREVERLYDQTWMFVTESLLAFTIFRDEFDVPFLLMFGFLLFVKCFHWLMADRVESMDQTTYPGPPTLFHIRINSLFFVLWAVDLIMFGLAIESTWSNGVGGMVLFASEYAILLASALNAMLRYILSVLELRRARARGGENAPPWENKSMYIFYIDLLTDFLKLTTYMTFFLIILTFYGLPLNILRDFFFTARSFITRLRTLVRYLNATRDMDRRYPDATEAELSEMSDRTCIICREEMHSRNPIAQPHATVPPQQQQQQPVDGPNMTPKKLPCGHIFHFQCLRSWLERQQSCPTCRRTVLETNPPATPNQAPGQGQVRVAAPRPGAAPGAPPGQQGAAAPANPLGWVGRFLGVAPQPVAADRQFPAAQAQFAQGAAPAVQHPQPLLNAQWGAQPVPGQAAALPPPPYYDVMHGWQQPMPGQPPQLQPPPLFRGFYGPGQAWQPWADPQWFAPQQQGPPGEQRQDLPMSMAGQPIQPPGFPADPASGEDQREESRITDASQAPTPTGAHVAGDARQPESTRTANVLLPPASQEHEARLAAGLAALERLKRTIETRTNNLSDSDASGRGAGVTTQGASSSTEPTVQSSSDSPMPSVSGSSSTTSSAHPPNGSTSETTTTETPAPTQHEALVPPSLPSLIPLFDLNTRLYVPPYSSAVFNPSSYRVPPGARVNPLYQAGRAPTQTTRLSSRVSGSGSGSGSGMRTPLSQLPQTLTAEQLARLDRLTREAIDERLRVLEGVSGAVFRCVEELTRMRSVLPLADMNANANVNVNGRRAEERDGVSSVGPSGETESESELEGVERAVNGKAVVTDVEVASEETSEGEAGLPVISEGAAAGES